MLIYLGAFTFANAQITYEPAFPNVSFQFPVEFMHPGDGTDRMFVVQQSGEIKVFPRNRNVAQSQVTTFIDLSSKVSFAAGLELGLLGLAFHPDFQNNGYFYTYYTSTGSGTNPRMILSRFSVSATNPNVADLNSEEIIFQFDKNQNNSNHNGGKIAFGPDGYLYISIGDGGGGNDPQRNAQNINNVFGSICRIDVDVDGSNPLESNPVLPNGNYEIPSDNPFLGQPGADEIFAYGIRNTWKFSFDSPTGRMWGADVGQGAFEEINLIQNGKNYGWNRFEGESVSNNVAISGPVENPVLFYDHSQNDVSITGGYVYRGSAIKSTSPAINSQYIFGDYISGRVWSMDYNNATGRGTRTFLFKTNGEFISSFGTDINNELYFTSYGTNARIFKIVDGVSATVGNTLNGSGTWEGLGAGINNGTVNTVATASNGDVYYGGNFNQVGNNVTANNIAVYNQATGWRSLAAGTNGTVNDIKTAANGSVYIAGAFTQVNGVSAKGVAVWNGAQWSALGLGTEIEGIAFTLEIDSADQVYVGGIFENLNGILAQNIAKWNGTAWTTLTDSTTNVAGTNNEIRSMEIDPVTNELYIGGNFDTAGAVNANRIAVWNDVTQRWSSLGNGTSGFVQAIVATDTDVFAGGNFALAGSNITVNRLARWNKQNNTWNIVGSGVDNLVETLAHDGENLYVGGSFNLVSFNSENFIANGIAKWNTTTGWQTLGENTVGVNGRVSQIEVNTTTTARELYIAGNFSSAGSIAANKTAFFTNEIATPPPTPVAPVPVTPVLGDEIVIEAETFVATNGTFNDASAGGPGLGVNATLIGVNYVNSQDYAEYEINVGTAGDYSIAYLISSPSDNAAIEFSVVNTAVSANDTVINNGSWDNYQPLNSSSIVQLNAGLQTVRITAYGSNLWQWNLDKITLTSQTTTTPVVVTPPLTSTTAIVIEAEDFTSSNGTTDDSVFGGSGLGVSIANTNINYVNAGDYIMYDINAASAGNYNLEYLISTPSDNAAIQMLVNGTLVATDNVINNGSWDNFVGLQSSSIITLAAGANTIRINASGSNFWQWNLDKITLTPAGQTGAKSFDILNSQIATINVYPNPTTDQIYFSNKIDLSNYTVKMYDTKGVEFKVLLHDDQSINMSDLTKGIYFVSLKDSDNRERIIKVIKD